ncbi:uncharacterized protein LOC62_04G005330 [Vanrija pseudolonga]|uniref:Uncharacterized protein n=1 Tax=Vanrija pseudolonga TaxID=143232 RepID=A0AAF0YC96_9TREE|nr:hypothetical protein LOC62_04G005330 [Vanrija pseudolonga]
MSLDHTAYPALIDTIISHAGVPALAALRATSKAFKSRIDAYLLAHAELYYFPVTRTAPELRHAVPGLTLPLNTPIPVLSELPRLPFAPEAVTTLDVVLPLSVRRAIATAYSSLHTLRRLQCPLQEDEDDGFRPSHTLVDFVTLPVGHLAWCQLPPGVKRYIAHLKYDEYQGHGDYGTEISEQVVSVREVVFVLCPTRKVDEPPGPMEWLFQVLQNTVLDCDMDAEVFSVTLVGAERAFEPPEGEDASTAAHFDAIKDLLREYITRSLEADGPTSVEEFADDVLRALRLVTLDDWWAELGNRQEIEGVWMDLRGHDETSTNLRVQPAATDEPGE